MLLALAVALRATKIGGTEEAVKRRCDWYDGYSDAFTSWFKSAEDDCRDFIKRKALWQRWAGAKSYSTRPMQRGEAASDVSS